ncbi:MAG: hypothetical protein OEW48_14280 [Phycisphaerae bacterium]|nr:hypothetical protein [Phycisphaerae bacterium]
MSQPTLWKLHRAIPKPVPIFGTHLRLKDFEQAEGFAKSAYEKAVGMKYRLAERK